MPRKRKIPPGESDGSEYEPSEPDASNSRPRARRLRDVSAHFTKSSTATDLDMSLCPRCRRIDLDAVFEAAGAGEDLHGTIIAYLDTIPESVIDFECQLCAVLSEAGLPKDDHGMRWEPWERFKLCAFDSLTVRGFPRTKARLTETSTIALTVLSPSLEWIDQTEDPAFIIPLSRPEARIQQHSRFAYHARQLFASTINYGLLSDWLRDCEREHEGCRLQRAMIKPLKVIDCLQRRIITSAPRTEYVALSYVWGRCSNDGIGSSPVKAKNEVPKKIPGVILDAMRLVISLGFQNLWVDRFCIDQGDLEEKHEQISHMDEIYEGALFTIVVALRKATTRGLPGVSIPRLASPCVQISDKLSLRAVLHLSRSLTVTKWNSRGWTYQEFCLSRRCLILVDDQVHFICRRGRTCEGVEESALSRLPFAKRRCLDSGILENFQMKHRPAFIRQLSAYTRRDLSYESDILNAFRGILSRSQLASYWGVPIYSTDTIPNLTVEGTEVEDPGALHVGFLLGLCWQAPFAMRGYKRHGFPSWSWVSNRGPIEYPSGLIEDKKNDELWVDKNTVETSAEVFLDSPSAHDQAGVSVIPSSFAGRSRIMPERGQFIYIRNVVKAVPIESWLQLRQNWVVFDCEKEPEHLESPLEMILLISKQSQHALSRYYMIITMEGDTARRIGLADISDDHHDSLLTDLGVRTIKLG